HSQGFRARIRSRNSEERPVAGDYFNRRDYRRTPNPSRRCGSRRQAVSRLAPRQHDWLYRNAGYVVSSGYVMPVPNLLKIRWPQGREVSNPTLGTNHIISLDTILVWSEFALRSKVRSVWFFVSNC